MPRFLFLILSTTGTGFVLGALFLSGLSIVLGNSDLDMVGGLQGWFVLGGFYGGIAGVLLGIILAIVDALKNKNGI